VPVGWLRRIGFLEGHVEYRDSIEERRFREEVREWLRANQPKERRPNSVAGQMVYDRAWQRAQFDGGWAGLAWPKEYGGRGLSPTQQLIWSEEYASAHCPSVHDSCWLGLNHAGPTLIVRGTEAQKSFHLPRILKGESTWCQGFSEPNAGSDLAALRTRGVVDGNHLVVNGQKIWTSFAQLTDYQELLVRSGPAESRHRGLTWIICDMRLPGIEVRPIKALDGIYHNCEVFYDNVRIPLSNVVGEIGDGWSVVMTTFGFERGPAAFSSFCQVAMALEALISYARSHPGPGAARRAFEDGTIADRLGVARAQVQSLRALMYMMVEAAERKIELGAEGSLMHLPYTELDQAIYRLAIDILGPRSVSRSAANDWIFPYFKSFSATIAGGTSEIQRNIIGERLLGLPR
jgi:alkylation response protein AidB-like acyl-CoA dehydrogenase